MADEKLRLNSPLRMLQNLGWSLQFMALVIVGLALLVGLFYGALRTELAMLAIGGGLFLLGRRLMNRG